MNVSHTTKALTAAGAAAVLTLALAGPGHAAAAPTGARPADRPAGGLDDVAVSASGFATKVHGGQVPANSSPTAYAILACGAKAGQARENHLAAVDLPGLGTTSAATTRVWTRRAHGTLHSYARNSVASVVLNQSPLGVLRLRAVSALSHTWYDGDTFHAATRTSVGKLEFVPTGGKPQQLDLPTPNRPIVVPGVAKISIGASKKVANDERAIATASALHVSLLPTGTHVYVASSKSQAFTGVRNGRFSGYSAGTEVAALDSLLTSGRNPLTVMGCQGTDGETVGKSDASVDIGGQVVVHGVSSKQWSRTTRARSTGWERGAVAGLSLGGGALKVDGVVGKATVTRTASGKLHRSAKGSTVARITVNGKPQEIPLNQVIEIPGLAKIEPKVVEKLPTGLKVIGLRITVLDGTGAVIDLGVAKMRISRR